MARPKTPTIPDDKIHYFREQLFAELSHMFTWEGLPENIPIDYLERNLTRNGFVMYYEDETIGPDILKCAARGYNRHEQPTIAQAVTSSDDLKDYSQTRAIKRLSDGKKAVELFDKKSDCVLIQNMDYGQNLLDIVEHFAQRLALAQQSFDTNLMWTNIPYIFKVENSDMKLSIESMFASIFNGEPFIITDKMLFAQNTDRTGLPTDIKYIGKELLDTLNEIMMKFRERVGFDTAGVDKAERLVTAEVKSNNQHTRTCLEIMLRQREIAAEAINAFYGLSVTVKPTGEEEQAEDMTDTLGEEGEEENGASDNRTPTPATSD